MKFLVYIKYGLLFLLNLIVLVSTAQDDNSVGMVMSVSSDKGNLIRVLNNSEPLEFGKTLAQTKRFIVKGTRRVSGEESLKNIGTIDVPRSYEGFKAKLNEDDYNEFKTLLNLQSDAEVTAFLNKPESILSMVLFTELKVDFVYALGLGYLDQNVEAKKLYEYEVYREDLNGKQELWGSTIVFAKSGNTELDRIKMAVKDITPTDSSIVFTWDVEIPEMEDLDFPDLENTKRPGILSTKKYTPETNYDQLLPYINRYLLTDVSTKFVPFYRINDEKDWLQGGKIIAGMDSVTGKHFITYTVNCLPNDVIESLVVPEDYVANRGPKSETVVAIAAHQGSVGFIYDVQARDSVNSIILTWDKLAEQPYYAGIEIAKGWNEEEPSVVATLPANATSYIDNQVFPAGRLFSYYVRPLFINLNGLQQEVPAVVTHSCTTFSKPSVPYNLQVKTEGDLVKISWEGSEDPAFHSYHVLRGATPQNMGIISPNVYEKEYRDSLEYLSGRDTHYYAVMAMNVTQDTSEYSNFVSYVPEKKIEIQSPPYLAYEVVNGAAYLSWDDVKLNDKYIAGYILQKKAENSNFRTIHTGIWEYNQYVDHTFEVGKTSYYRVASVSIKGDTAAYSMEMTAGGPIPDLGLEPINGVKLTNLSKSIRISWPSVSNQVVSKYKVYKKLPTDRTFTLLKEANSGNFEAEDDKVESGKIYVYAVTVVNSKNQESEISEEKAIYRE